MRNIMLACSRKELIHHVQKADLVSNTPVHLVLIQESVPTRTRTGAGAVHDDLYSMNCISTWGQVSVRCMSHAVCITSMLDVPRGWTAMDTYGVFHGGDLI